MNTYLQQQIQNIELYLNTFVTGCELATMKDDGKRDKTEERELQAIKKAIKRFKTDLQSLL